MFSQLKALYCSEMSATRDLVRDACADLPLEDEMIGGGKMLRALMTLASAQAVGGQAAQAIPCAAALELLHLASIVHDDIIDEAATRRARPSLQNTVGGGRALVLGDVLIFRAQGLALRGLGGTPAPWQAQAALMLAEAGEACALGEFAGLTHRRAPPCPDSYLQIAADKSGALFGAATALGGLCGGAASEVVDALRAFATHVGVCYQIVDDLMDLWEDHTTCDTQQGQVVSLPLILRELSHDGPKGPVQDVATLFAQCQSLGVIEECKIHYAAQRATAMACLARAGDTHAIAALGDIFHKLDHALDEFSTAPQVAKPAARKPGTLHAVG